MDYTPEFISADRRRWVRHFNYWAHIPEGDYYAVYEVVGELPDGRNPWTVDNKRIGFCTNLYAAINLAKGEE